MVLENEWTGGLAELALELVEHQFPVELHGDESYFGTGSTIVAFSGNKTSPGLPLIRYWIFNSLGTPGAGSPPKPAL